MRQSKRKKNMTVDDLAIMVAGGFNDVTSKMGEMTSEIEDLRHDVQAYNSNVKNYLNLSEKRYSELKQRDALLAQWIKLVAAKTKVPIDVSQLEKI